jgi:hypothetical protein
VVLIFIEVFGASNAGIPEQHSDEYSQEPGISADSNIKKGISHTIPWLNENLLILYLIVLENTIGCFVTQV